jgi:hypothetical protein
MIHVTEKVCKYKPFATCDSLSDLLAFDTKDAFTKCGMFPIYLYGKKKAFYITNQFAELIQSVNIYGLPNPINLILRYADDGTLGFQFQYIIGGYKLVLLSPQQQVEFIKLFDSL